ncbi:hypothetical protein ACFL6I_22295 [candidate division KSB1 bacterium]
MVVRSALVFTFLLGIVMFYAFSGAGEQIKNVARYLGLLPFGIVITGLLSLPGFLFDFIRLQVYACIVIAAFGVSW